MANGDTKQKILDAAEQLFANQGFAATSLRTIIRAAGVNTAAVHYHFGSREGLIEAVMQRRATPINQERLRELESLEAAYSDGSIPLDRLVEAFLGPPVRLHFDRTSGGSILPRLMARAITEADTDIHDMFKKLFGEVFMRFTGAFVRTLPGLSPVEIRWRMHFMLASLAFTIAVPDLQSGVRQPGEDLDAPGKPAQAESVDTVLGRLVSFVTAGMRTPAFQQTRAKV